MLIGNAFMLMLLGHLIADYTLQGWLASAKSKKWWNENAPGERCRHDYVAALVCHALYWSIIVCMPFFNHPYFGIAVVLNSICHAIIDDMKANRGMLNLCEDQVLHVCQIALTLLVLGVLS